MYSFLSVKKSLTLLATCWLLLIGAGGGFCAHALYAVVEGLPIPSTDNKGRVTLGCQQRHEKNLESVVRPAANRRSWRKACSQDDEEGCPVVNARDAGGLFDAKIAYDKAQERRGLGGVVLCQGLYSHPFGVECPPGGDPCSVVMHQGDPGVKGSSW